MNTLLGVRNHAHYQKNVKVNKEFRNYVSVDETPLKVYV